LSTCCYDSAKLSPILFSFTWITTYKSRRVDASVSRLAQQPTLFWSRTFSALLISSTKATLFPCSIKSTISLEQPRTSNMSDTSGGTLHAVPTAASRSGARLTKHKRSRPLISLSEITTPSNTQVMTPSTATSQTPIVMHSASSDHAPENTQPRLNDGVVQRSGLSPTASRQGNPTPPHSPLFADYNKPLPSPPVARLVDPNSPLKAQRTLIDAETVVPSIEQWPILRPHNSLDLASTPPTDKKQEVRSTSGELTTWRIVTTPIKYDTKGGVVSGSRTWRIGSNNPYARYFQDI
jgi:hypothetical protein